MCKFEVFWLGLLVFSDQIHSFFFVQFFLGDCPVTFQEPCNRNMVKFILSTTTHNTTSLYELNPFLPKLPRNFNVLKPLKIVIHGFGGLTVDTATTNVTKAYQDVGYNMIIVDWEKLATLPCYATAYLNTWHVGQCVAILAVSLIPLGINPNFIHLVGFSLGAHIAGFAGANLKEAVGYSFGRITGLDPALPFFATLKNDWKLDPSDADFVDVIHTSAGLIGKLETTGHVDFYVNGGAMQPFCHEARYPPLCSHILAGLYFAESIRRKGIFVGVECDNVLSYWLGLCNSAKNAIMGETCKYSTRGVFYVTTSDKPPFALFYY